MKHQITIAFFFLIASVGHGKDNQKFDAPDKPELLFLLAGQSNMAGNGFTTDLPNTNEYKEYSSSPENVSVWNAKQKSWEVLKLKNRFGPEIGFAHTLSKALPDKHIGIIKYAVGGTSMDKWKPGGELYSRLLFDFRNAQKSVPDAKLAAMLWHQGESDSDDKGVAEAYKAKLVQHINSIRKDTEVPQLLFIYGQINPGESFRGATRWKYADIVRKAQKDLDLVNTAMVETDDCEKNAYVYGAARTPKDKQINKREDNVHYSAKGQIELGKRFAEIYLKKAKTLRTDP